MVGSGMISSYSSPFAYHRRVEKQEAVSSFDDPNNQFRHSPMAFVRDLTRQGVDS